MSFSCGCLCLFTLCGFYLVPPDKLMKEFYPARCNNSPKGMIVEGNIIIN